MEQRECDKIVEQLKQWHRDMWNELAETGGNKDYTETWERFLCSDLYSRMNESTELCTAATDILSATCFCCGIDTILGSRDCTKCPINWFPGDSSSELEDCTSEDSLYDNWWNASTEERKVIAKKIAEAIDREV